MEGHWKARAVLFVSCGLIQALPSIARAETSPQLIYERTGGADLCPSEAEFRRAVHAGIGHDPFTAASQLTLVVRLEGHPNDWSGEATFFDASRSALSHQRLTSRSESCGPLGSALALAVGVALDQVTPVPAPATTPSLTLSHQETKAVHGTPVRILLAIGGSADFGTAPVAAASAMVEIEAKRESLALGLELHLQPWASMSVGSGQVGTSLWTGVVASCWQPGLLGGCATFWLGDRVASAQGLPGSRQVNALFAAVGVRAQADFPVFGRLWLRPSADLLVPLTSDVFVVDQAAVWKSPPVSFILGLAVVTGV